MSTDFVDAMSSDEISMRKYKMCWFSIFFFTASVHQQSPIIDRVAASTPPTLSNLSSDSAYDKFRLLNGHHVSLSSGFVYGSFE